MAPGAACPRSRRSAGLRPAVTSDSSAALAGSDGSGLGALLRGADPRSGGSGKLRLLRRAPVTTPGETKPADESELGRRFRRTSQHE